MADRPVKRSLLLALALPILAIAVLAARAERTTREGRPYRVRITGYDPRDLVRGHYLRYRLAFHWDPPGDQCASATCCYCLRGPADTEPLVTRIACSETARCDASFPDERLQRLEEFYIPEDKGDALGAAVRTHDAQLRVHVSAGGDVVIQELLLDGRPWREVVP